MKIKKMSINGFGRFINTEISVSDGLNLIYGENEAGKSTLQSFIKAMLFGFPSQRTDGEGRLPESKKYEPWYGTEYSGSLGVVTDEGRFLRVERDFSKNECRVYDRNLQDVTSEFPYIKREGLQVGEKLLNMDRACFESSAYIKQGGTIVFQDQRSGLFEKLMNLVQTGDESLSAANAVSALKEAATSLGNTRTKNRPYNLTVDELVKYKSLLDRAEEKNRDMLEHKSKLSTIESELARLEARLEREDALDEIRPLLLEREALTDSANKYHQKSSRIEELKKEASGIMDSIEQAGLHPEITEEAVISHLSKAALGADKMKSMPSEDPDIIYRKISDHKKRRRIFSSIAYGGIAVSAAAAIILHPLLFSLTAVFTVFLIAVLMKKPPHTEKEAEGYLAIKRECSENLFMINAFIESAGLESAVDFSDAESKLNGILKTLSRNGEMRSKLEVLESRIRDMEENLAETLGDYADIEILNARIKRIDRTIMDSGFTEEELAAKPDAGLPDLYNRKRSEAGGITLLLREYLQSEDEIAEIVEKVEFYTKRLEAIELEKNALLAAADTIGEAAEKLKGRIVPEINEKTGDILSDITGGKYETLAAGPDMSLKTKSKETVRSIWEFSDGTVDQMYFALRLAVLDVFSEKEKVPVLVDEVFAYYDENRIKNALEFLLEFSKSTQVLLFTCKEREVGITGETGGANIIRL